MRGARGTAWALVAASAATAATANTSSHQDPTSSLQLAKQVISKPSFLYRMGLICLVFCVAAGTQRYHLPLIARIGEFQSQIPSNPVAKVKVLKNATWEDLADIENQLLAWHERLWSFRSEIMHTVPLVDMDDEEEFEIDIITPISGTRESISNAYWLTLHLTGHIILICVSHVYNSWVPSISALYSQILFLMLFIRAKALADAVSSSANVVRKFSRIIGSQVSISSHDRTLLQFQVLQHKMQIITDVHESHQLGMGFFLPWIGTLDLDLESLVSISCGLAFELVILICTRIASRVNDPMQQIATNYSMNSEVLHDLEKEHQEEHNTLIRKMSGFKSELHLIREQIYHKLQDMETVFSSKRAKQPRRRKLSDWGNALTGRSFTFGVASVQSLSALGGASGVRQRRKTKQEEDEEADKFLNSFPPGGPGGSAPNVKRENSFGDMVQWSVQNIGAMIFGSQNASQVNPVAADNAVQSASKRWYDRDSDLRGDNTNSPELPQLGSESGMAGAGPDRDVSDESSPRDFALLGRVAGSQDQSALSTLQNSDSTVTAHPRDAFQTSVDHANPDQQAFAVFPTDSTHFAGRPLAETETAGCKVQENGRLEHSAVAESEHRSRHAAAACGPASVSHAYGTRLDPISDEFEDCCEDEDVVGHTHQSALKVVACSPVPSVQWLSDHTPGSSRLTTPRPESQTPMTQLSAAASPSRSLDDGASTWGIPSVSTNVLHSIQVASVPAASHQDIPDTIQAASVPAVLVPAASHQDIPDTIQAVSVPAVRHQDPQVPCNTIPSGQRLTLLVPNVDEGNAFGRGRSAASEHSVVSLSSRDSSPGHLLLSAMAQQSPSSQYDQQCLGLQKPESPADASAWALDTSWAVQSASASPGHAMASHASVADHSTPLQDGFVSPQKRGDELCGPSMDQTPKRTVDDLLSEVTTPESATSQEASLERRIAEMFKDMDRSAKKDRAKK